MIKTFSSYKYPSALITRPRCTKSKFEFFEFFENVLPYTLKQEAKFLKVS